LNLSGLKVTDSGQKIDVVLVKDAGNG